VADWQRLHEHGQRASHVKTSKTIIRRPFETFWCGRGKLAKRPNYKAILWDTLFHDCGFTVAQIAKAFGKNPGTVRTQVNYETWKKNTTKALVYQSTNKEYNRKYQKNRLNKDWDFRFKSYMNALVQQRPEYLRDIESWSPEDRQRVSDIYEKCYRLCQEHGPRSYHVDHIVPYAVGGRHVPDNLRILTRSENTSRPKNGSDILDPDVG
jgi:5-methylcytosine-specific restriction endonuclease McrA